MPAASLSALSMSAVSIPAGSMPAASMSAPSLSERWPIDQEVFVCHFDQEQWDKNFDHWPDGWTRHHGPGYPTYLEMKCVEESAVPSGWAFTVQLDGGAAAVFSPPIPASAVYAYVLEVLVKTQGLQHHRAYLSLNFLDAKLRVVGRSESEKLTGTMAWQKVRLGPVEVQPPEACFVRVGLHLEPGSQADLAGEASFADVWLGRLPRLKMWVEPRTHLFSSQEEVEIFCEASGFSNRACQIEWELRDVWGKVLAHHNQALQVEVVSSEPTASRPDTSQDSLLTSQDSRGSSGSGPPISFRSADRSKPNTSSPASSKPAPSEPKPVYQCKGSWRPRLEGPGFYRVSSRLVGISACTPPCQLDFAVLAPGPQGNGGEFGWSVPEGDKPLSLDVLATLVCQMGLRWLKYPVWFDLKADGETLDAWVVFSERLNAQGIEIVGILARPPVPVAKQFAASNPLAADIFAMDPAQWWPAVEPILLRLAPRIHWWQLGQDHDQSFVGFPRLEEKIARVKAQWELVGKDLHIGFGWDWMHALPKARAGPTPWKFLALWSKPTLTAEELGEALQATANTGLVRWVVVEPLPKETYPLQERAADLVRQMTAAKIAGAEGIFFSDPFHPQTGLMHPDGTAAELLLVWRTIAQALSGAQYLGTLPLPQSSPNHLFLRGKEALLIVWNEHPTEEVLYLGEQVEQVDLWGRSQPLHRQGQVQRISVGRLPSLVRGLDPTVAQWRMHCQIATVRIPSLFGQPHPNTLQIHNPLDRGVSGTARVIVPEGWTLQPDQMPFRLGPGEKIELPFSMMLPYTATNGHYPLLVEIRLQADRFYQLSVHRWIDVGLGDVYIQIANRLNDRHELEVEQRLVNETEQPVAFECQLFAPGRKRLRTQVFLAGTGQEIFVYRFPDGEELIGKTLWLQATELGGSRILNYRFTVSPPQIPTKSSATP